MCIAGNQRQGNPQTDALLAMLELEHRVTIPWKGSNGTTTHTTAKKFCIPPPAFPIPTEEHHHQQQRDPNEIPLGDEVTDEVHALGLLSPITNHHMSYLVLLVLKY